MDWEPVKVAQKLRCGDWTRRTNVTAWLISHS